MYLVRNVPGSQTTEGLARSCMCAAMQAHTFAGVLLAVLSEHMCIWIHIWIWIWVRMLSPPSSCGGSTNSSAFKVPNLVKLHTCTSSLQSQMCSHICHHTTFSFHSETCWQSQLDKFLSGHPLRGEHIGQVIFRKFHAAHVIAQANLHFH